VSGGDKWAKPSFNGRHRVRLCLPAELLNFRRNFCTLKQSPWQRGPQDLFPRLITFFQLDILAFTPIFSRGGRWQRRLTFSESWPLWMPRVCVRGMKICIHYSKYTAKTGSGISPPPENHSEPFDFDICLSSPPSPMTASNFEY